MMLRAQDIRGVWAIIPTPANADADHWSATATVDVAEVARLTDRLIVDGVDGLIALGTTGESATLTDDEYYSAVDAVIDTASGRVPAYIGATTLGTHETVRRLRYLQSRGASGTMLGLPMWQPCTEEMALRFYATVSEAFPDLPIMVYMNPGAFRFDFPASFWQLITAVAPTVTSAKYTRAVPFGDCVAAAGPEVNFLPIDMSAAVIAREHPDDVTAVWSTAAAMGPSPAIALMRAIAAQDWSRVEQVDQGIAWANETFLPPNPAEFGVYNIQLEKTRMDAAGYCRPGPIRPPYDVLPSDLEVRARECGRRWAELHHTYSAERT